MRSLMLTVLIALVATATTPAQDKPRRGTAKLTEIEVKTEKHRYARPKEGDLYLHVHYPPEWKPTDRRPVIVFFFGGGWKNGSYLQFVPQAKYFASRGIVAACADYRISSVHKTTPDRAVEDARAAIRWVRRNSGRLGIDPGRVIGSGGSAGGHLAAATALLTSFDPVGGGEDRISCKPDVLVLFNPALNLVGLGTIRDAGGKDITKEFSPTLSLKKDAPPTLLLFGTNDRMLPQGKEYLNKAHELGARAELHTASGQPHGFFNRPPWMELTTKKADEFLVSLGYLGGKSTIKLPSLATLEKVEPGKE